MNRSPLRALGAASVLAAALFSSAVQAQAPADNPRAQTLFQEGRAAIEKGDYKLACDKFTESLALVSRAGTLLNLAQCEEHEGRLLAAGKHWAAGIALLPPNDERLAISRQKAADLDKRTPRLTVRLAGAVPPDAAVKVEGIEATLAELQAGVAVDPGPRKVVLKLPGKPDKTSSVTLAEGQSQTVDFELGAAEVVIVKDGGAQGQDKGGGVRTAGFVVGGVGVAGLVVAGVTGGILLSKHSQIQKACPDPSHCSKAGLDLIDGTKGLDVVNGVAWGVGGAALATGIVLVIVGGPKPAQTSSLPVSFTAGPAPGGAFASLRGAF